MHHALERTIFVSFQYLQAITTGITRVNNYRQVVGFSQGKMFTENTLLVFMRTAITIVVKPRFTDRDDLRLPNQRFKGLPVLFGNFCGIVGMDSNAGIYVIKLMS